MIDWGTTPIVTVGTLYLPGVSAVDVIGLADRLYTRNRLQAVDEHSVQMEVAGGVSYLPVPTGGIGDLAGLLTLDLPSTVKQGQRFRVVLHQVIDAPPTRPHPILTEPSRNPVRRSTKATIATAETTIGSQTAVDRKPRPSRHIVGSFQFSVLVENRAEILPIVERTLTKLRRVTNKIPVENRWYAVMHRYLQQVTAKFDALGGKPDHDHDHDQDREHEHVHDRDRDRDREHEHERDHERRVLEGKIAGVRFDTFGDFDGFLLKTPHGEHEFFTRERDMETTVKEAWRQQIAVRVIANEHTPHEPTAIIFLRPHNDD
jgi:hypothetical protein